MAFVVDTSVALAWCLPDERSTIADNLLALCMQSFGIVPALWPTEVANGLLVAERKGRITAANIDIFLEKLRALDMRVQSSSLQQTDIIALARQHRLTVYDAAYLHLAQRHHLPLATFDNALARTAMDSGVELL